MSVGAKCLIARSNLSRYVADLKQSTMTEKAGGLIKTGYLASLKTGERITGSNIVQGMADMSVRNIVAAADYLQALVRSAATLGKVKPYEMRHIASTVNLPGFKATAKSFAEGLGQAKTIMETGVNPGVLDQAIQASPFGQNQTHYKNPVLDKVTRAIGNYIAAIHQPFYNVAMRTSMYGRLRLAGIRAGLSGKALTAYIDRGFANPSEDVFLGAHTDAALTAFKNETIISNLATAARTRVRRGVADPEAAGVSKAGWRAASLAMDITVPFTRIAGAIANVAADYSPAGFVKAAAASMEPNPRLQADVATRLTKASIGTGLILWGMKAQQAGNATGSLPTDPGERARWAAEGKKPNSVKLDGKWRSISWLGPLSIPFLIGVETSHAQETKQTSIGQMVAQGAGFFAKTMTEMSFLSAISNLVSAVTDPQRSAAGVAAQTVPIPTIVSQAAQAVDPYERTATGFVDKLKSRIPLASRTLPPRLDAFGDTLKRASGLSAITDVTSPSTARDDAVTREMDRLGVNPGGVAGQVNIDGQKVERTNEERNAITTEFGPLKRGILERLIASPTYQKLPDEIKARVLSSALRSVSHTATDVDQARRHGAKIPQIDMKTFLSNPANE